MNIAPSYWEKSRWLMPADVLVVGAGLAGLWTAYEIKRRSPKTRVLMLERSAIPTGASTRNAGFACFGSPSELLHDATIMGESAMLGVVEMRYKGIQKILQTFGETAIGFEPCGGYECFENWPLDYADQLALLNKLLQPVAGNANSFSIANDQLAGFGMQGFAGMVASKAEGALHSGMYVSALSKLVASMGIDILYGEEVLGYEQYGNKFSVATSTHQFEATQIVLATNAYLPALAPSLHVKPARGQVLVTQPIPGLTLRGTFHFDEGFYYWRHLEDNRILLGGARNADIAAEETTEIKTSGTIQTALETFLIRHFPQHFNAQNMQQQVALRWAGLMAMSETKLPIVQQVEPGIWAMMCCNGMGVALTPIMAEKLAEQVLTNT
ncbi:MAG TPA: FAD-binding oxidoreductase [Phnomibacter sp.]|nr:FAD-binding oxidoreductase [Phnomibacter sp.]